MIALSHPSTSPHRRVLPGPDDVVHPAYWVAAIGLIGAALSSVPLGQPAAVAVATVVFIGGGLPHGAYDIALLQRALAFGRSGIALAVGGYVAIALAMAALWMTWPLVALVLFLAAAAVHFGEDWRMLDEAVLRVAAGAAVIAVTTIGHPAEVSALFVAMSDPRAALIARIVTAAAPVALLITTVGIAVAWRQGSRQWAAAMASCFALLLILPPVAGFALFFVFLHSPRHLAETRVVLRDMPVGSWLGTGAGLSGLAILGWCALRAIVPSDVAPIAVAQAFQLLASVALPHLLFSRWLEGRLSAVASFQEKTLIA